MTARVSVRPARPGDGEGLARAWLDAGRYYAGLEPATFQQPESAGLVGHFERLLVDERGATVEFLVAEVEDRVVGWAVSHLDPALDAARYQLQRQFAHPRLVVDAVAVEEAFRGRGVGGRLMHALEEWGRRRGALVAVLDTYPDSELSVPFFKGLGYRRRSIRLQKTL